MACEKDDGDLYSGKPLELKSNKLKMADFKKVKASVSHPSEYKDAFCASAVSMVWTDKMSCWSGTSISWPGSRVIRILNLGSICSVAVWDKS